MQIQRPHCDEEGHKTQIENSDFAQKKAVRRFNQQASSHQRRCAMENKRIRHYSTAVLLIFLSWVFLAGLAGADTLQTHEYAVTASGSWETTPRLGNDGVSELVVFTRADLLADGSIGKGDIFYQRLAGGAPDGAAVQVTFGTQDNQLNDVSGDYIVYTAYDSTSSVSGRIMVYQISSTLLYGIGSALVIREPRISGSKVVWREGGAAATMVMIYDLSWLGPAPDAAALPPRHWRSVRRVGREHRESARSRGL